MKDRVIECGECGTKVIAKHFNTKYCEDCRMFLLRKPKTTLTEKQILRAEKLIGTMDRKDIAKKLGVSLSNLKRAFAGRRLAYHNKYAINPDLVKKVSSYYEKHGKKKTQEKFPDVNVRSIVERYKLHSPRQTRWTDRQLLDLVRMGGIVSMEKQAKYFNRPLANKGSIISVWQKRFGYGGGQIHGMSLYKARLFVKDTCPVLETDFWVTRCNRKNVPEYRRKICLWVDMEKHLKSECPAFIKEAVVGLAEFQRWIFSSKDPKKSIKEIKNKLS